MKHKQYWLVFVTGVLMLLTSCAPPRSQFDRANSILNSCIDKLPESAEEVLKKVSSDNLVVQTPELEFYGISAARVFQDYIVFEIITDPLDSRLGIGMPHEAKVPFAIPKLGPRTYQSKQLPNGYCIVWFD